MDMDMGMTHMSSPIMLETIKLEELVQSIQREGTKEGPGG